MGKAMDTWNSKIYSQFLDLRTRPARDLLAGISETQEPKLIIDLGCGPGNSTVLLKARWPHARVVGMDSSSNMLEEAKSLYPDIEFELGDIDQFSRVNKSEKIDCLFANASLQWLDDHQHLIPRLISLLKKGGSVGIQMPNNFHSPTHQTAVDILSSHKRWVSLLANLRYGKLTEPLYTLTHYYDWLSEAGVKNLQIWETEYFQEMNTHEDIFDWIKSTGLSPVLAKMNAEDKALFEKLYIEAIVKAYPLQVNHKILLPFRRIFMTGIVGS